ncbi:MAG: hypothetical protein HOC71_06000 [Candidatus Latescibacteria bacterium]|nr:hypothetical protein [Candidatus Latescibacterota bacterium]
MKSAHEGDVLASDVAIDEVVLFEAGTVLVKKRIEILSILNVESVFIESRDKKELDTAEDIYINIDERFSYVEDSSYMMSLKHLVKDIVGNMR